MPTITQTRVDHDLRSNLSFRVYTEGDKPRDMTGAWFDENNVQSLKFKRKAWNKVARAGVAISEKQMVPVVAKAFGLKPEDFTIRFSRYAGCSCGCSPGYVGKLLAYNDKLSRLAIYMKGFEATAEDLVAYNKVCEKQKANLAKEISLQSASV